MSANYTDAQRKCIESTDSKLVVSAAAGTGKTFTLTQKICWMLKNDQLSDINQVLAITFTNKAAGEIKARVRSTLRSMGLHDQALLVDGAWISTIHGMCSRILKSHALEANVDPGFKIIDELDGQKIMDEAIEVVLSQTDRDTVEFLSDYKISSNLKFETSVRDIVEGLISAAKSSSLGFDSINIGPKPMQPLKIAQNLYRRLSEAVLRYESCDCETVKFKDGLLARRQLLSELERIVIDKNNKFADVARVLNCETAKLGKMQAKDYPDIVESFLEDIEAWKQACYEIRSYKSYSLLQEAIDLAKGINKIYDSMKFQKGYLDNDDLMVLTYRLLKNYPDIAEEYKNQFRLLMVDEFQDTSQLQIDIISLITHESAQLCTVGDAQQSIYGFRGADVNVYDKFIEDARTQPVKLETNFRSNGCVLEFANRIFEQPRVFGNRFLYLHEGRPHSKDKDYQMPRAQIIAARGKGKTRGSSDGVDAHTKRVYQAAAIAREFSKFRENGCNPGDMVLLLGGMTHVDIYADALRAQGFEVVIAGGSGFWSSQECALVAAILGALANPHDTMCLYQMLGYGLVATADNTLIDITCSSDGKKKHLDKGLASIDDNSLPELQLLRSLVEDALCRLGEQSISSIVSQMLSDSGYMDRLRALGSQGSAACANLLKAIDYISNYEDEYCYGINAMTFVFASMVQNGGKEGPGVLMSGELQAVRIMTIHASKGLEFPVVAVAEFERGSMPSSFSCKAYRANTFAVLKPGSSISDFGNLKKAADEYEKSGEAANIDDAERLDSRAQFEKCIRNFYAREELGEEKRRFYVALTRASEAIIVCTPYRSSSKVSPDSLSEDICTAFFGSLGDENLGYPQDCGSFAYGDSMQGQYLALNLSTDTETGQILCSDETLQIASASEAAAPTSIPPTATRDDMIVEQRRFAQAAGMFSYSSIADTAMPVFAHNIDDKYDYMGELLLSDEDSSTELGTAFHATAEFMVLSEMLGGSCTDNNDGNDCTDGADSVDFASSPNGNIVIPSQTRINAILAKFDISKRQYSRYMKALENWCNSKIAARAATYQNLQAEVPFCMEFSCKHTQQQGHEPQTPHFINGQIDLLCSNPSSADALVIDYKTGGTQDQTEEELYQKHALQSMCYAYALLTSWANYVELAFVRVEHVDQDGQPQTIKFEYNKEDLPIIEKTISSALISSKTFA